MPFLTIVSCRIFEDELTYILKNDTENLSSAERVQIFVNEDDTSLTLRQKLSSQGIHFSLYSDADIISFESPLNRFFENSSVSRDDLCILVHVIPFSMEARPDKIKDAVYSVVSDYTIFSDAVLVMYGLCGNVLGGIEKDLSTSSCSVFILKDSDGNFVDDCICASVGGRARYMDITNEMDRGVGIYFLTPMQAVHWKEIAVLSGLTPDPDDEKMLRMVFEYSGYKYVGKIDTGLYFEPKFHEKTDEFCKKTGLEIVALNGTYQIPEQNFKRVKNYVLSKKSV